MEKKEYKISLSTFFLILAIIAILVMGYAIYNLSNQKVQNDIKVADLEEKVSQLEKSENVVNKNDTKLEKEEKKVEVSLGEYYIQGMEVTPEDNGVESIKLEKNNKVLVYLPLGTIYSGTYEIKDDIIICNISKETNSEGTDVGKSTNKKATLEFKIINDKQLKFYTTTDKTIKATLNKTYCIK